MHLSLFNRGIPILGAGVDGTTVNLYNHSETTVQVML